MIVIKRDGKEVAFNVNCIINALTKAFQSVGDNDYDIHVSVQAHNIAKTFANRDKIEITEIQDATERSLMLSGRVNVAKAYIEYRHERDISRDKRSNLKREIEGLIEQKEGNLLLNENGNKDSKVISTQRDLLAGIVAKEYAKSHILPPEIVAAHEAGELHYHDLDYAPLFPIFNCMLIDIKGMFKKGFRMGNADIEEPKSISTATAVVAQIIAQVASHIYGGTTINRIDELLAPYVKASYEKHLDTAIEYEIKDYPGYAWKQTEKECYNAFQSLEYEINTLHTSNGQTPFVSIGFGLGTSIEARLIQNSILKNRIAGLGKERKTAVFPKLIMSIKNGVNHKPSDPNYDIKQLALECASKRMYPDIINYEKVIEVTGSFKAPMGCRSFLSAYEEDGKEIHEGRNNLGVVSLNLPRIAIQASKSPFNTEQIFYSLLDKRLELVKKALYTRIKRLDGVTASVAPILYMEGACGVRLKANDLISEIFKNGRASISLGYIGLHETINALLGSEEHIFDSAKRQITALKIIKRMKKAVNKWKAESGYGFSLYATPSENLCDRFCRLDVAEFGEIKGVTDKGYYTNSFHLDVEKSVNPYDKIDFEMPYPELTSGGFICYGEFPNMKNNLKALEDVWDYSYTRVPYYGTNTPIDECYECGFTGEFKATSKGFTCPNCGNHNSETVSVTRRICGYLGSPNARPFNPGKQKEVIKRVKHL